MPAAPDVALSPASTLSSDRLAAVFTAGYEGYWFPIRLDADGFAAMVETHDLDLGASRVAVAAGSDVGVAVLGARRTEGWIGGMGVAEPWRRQGIGRRLLLALLASSRELGLRRVTLEVLEQNAPARGLYEQTGFSPVRELEVWSLPVSDTTPAEPAEPVALDTALSRIRALRTIPEPWQRADETLARQRAAGAELTALGDEEGAVVFRAGRQSPAQIIQLAAASTGSARRLLETISADFGGGTWINVATDDPARAALEDLDAAAVARQTEFELHL